MSTAAASTWQLLPAWKLHLPRNPNAAGARTGAIGPSPFGRAGKEGRSAMSRTRARRLLGSLAAAVVVAGVGAATSTGGAASVAAGGWRVAPSPAIAGGELLGVAALNGSDAWAVGTRAVGGVF